MKFTYADLKAFIESMTPEQQAMTAHVYAGDVDDFMPIFGTCFNSNEEMGTSLEGLPTTMPLLQI